MTPETTNRRIRWLPGVVILGIGALGMAIVRSLDDAWAFEQQRSYAFIGITLGTYTALVVWWLFFSRAGNAAKFAGLVIAVLPLVVFRHGGMSGDFVPIFELRFGKGGVAPVRAEAPPANVQRPDFPQLFGPDRDCRLAGPVLDADWKTHPPQLVWRRPVGAAWGGFAVAGGRAVTQEQDGENEAVTCYEVVTGNLIWKATNPGRYATTIAGEGPRATPTIVADRVFTLGALGTLRCLDLATGDPVWTRELTADAAANVPEWGFASSPLVHDGKVIVSAGGAGGKSLLAYRIADGVPVWNGGDRAANYSSPFLLTLAGRQQIVIFNSKAITAHDPATGAVLWERDWGTGLPNVARPIPAGGGSVFFSSGYGVGAALLDVKLGADGKFTTDQAWKTPRFQAKFSNPVERGGFVYGVSDGIFACLDLRDGVVKWKGGRYGHGQGLLVGEYYLQMTEQPGDLVLLRPTPEAGNELARIPVFDAKTWNPIALTGELLLVRNDREAACLRLPVK
jgi:outer membrane protein assembly factor BamB